jgi:hypothetical protein
MNIKPNCSKKWCMVQKKLTHNAKYRSRWDLQILRDTFIFMAYIQGKTVKTKQCDI